MPRPHDPERAAALDQVAEGGAAITGEAIDQERTAGVSPQPAPRPRNVIEALARVEAEIGGIRKLTPRERGSTEERGVTYAYRGIDQIAAAAQPLMGRYGVVMVPNVLDLTSREVTINGKPWDHLTIVVEWSIYGPGGPDDRITSIVRGEGRDNSDKAINKAMTTAFKNVLLRVLCIGDPADDTDHSRHETDAPDRPPPSLDWAEYGWADQAVHDVERERVRATMAAADPAIRAALRELWEQRQLHWPLSRAQLAEWDDAMASALASDEQPVADPSAPSADTPPSTTSSGERATSKAINLLIDAAAAAGVGIDGLTHFAAAAIDHELARLSDLTGAQAHLVHERLLELAVDHAEATP